MSKKEALNGAFGALSDPARRAMLLRLARGEATANELGEPLAISQPAVSRHIKVLESAGLIERRVDGPRRPCRLAAGALRDVDAFLDRLREALETQHAGLDQLLERMAKPASRKRRR